MFDLPWVRKWQDAVNSNGPDRWLGKHFTAKPVFGFGDREEVVAFDEDTLTEVSDQFGPETRYHLAIRGPAESWAKFCQPVSPPMDNDLWAMARSLRGRVRLEGAQMVLWQNMRALMWALDRRREV